MQQQSNKRLVLPALVVLWFVAVALSIRYGAVSIPMADMLHSLRSLSAGDDTLTLHERVFLYLRLPRALLCVFTGASLAVGGVLMQALFRNPVIEPGLIGTSSGAAFGAAFYFVAGASFPAHTGVWTLPLSAVAGGVLATILVFLLSRPQQSGKSSVVGLLLTGMAVNALFMSGVGFFSYIARDPQARSITFWGMGNLSGASWTNVRIVAISTIVSLLFAVRFARQLNALMLGEEEAQFLGVNVRKLKVAILLINAVMIGIATAFVGVISFVGLIVPHLVRLLVGADNRKLIPYCALLGGILLSAADILSRMLLRPAELPIGIVTSVVGAPLLIFLLRRKNYFF